MNIDLTRLVDQCRRVFPDCKLKFTTRADMPFYDNSSELELTVRGVHGTIRVDPRMPEDYLRNVVAEELTRRVVKGLLHGN